MAKDQLVQTSQVDLESWGKERGIKYFMVNFTDLLGAQRTKLVPLRGIAGMQEGGAGFAGFAGGLDYTPAHPDMLVLPDADCAVQVPWQPDIAWVPGNPVMKGEYSAQAPRNVLRKQIAEAAELGLHFKIGVEPEFSLLSPDGRSLADELDTRAKPCYDQQSMMRNYHVIREISEYMLELGWGNYQNDHEDANGQWEMNWDFDDVLKMADQLSFFKFMVKYVAEKHGMRASFMPKPLPHLTGNGLHAHISAWDAMGDDAKTNLFAGDDDTPTGRYGLSETGKHFLGGLIEHGSGLTVICCPSVNSYKRIGAPATASGSSWAPTSITWAGDNRTHLVRVPGGGRMELRLPDGSSNPYLMPAVIMAAGLNGIRNKADPGEAQEIDMFAEGHKVKNAPPLPHNMLDGLRRFEEDEVLTQAMGAEFTSAFLKLKHREWRDYANHFTEWERDHTLDI
ncbi:type III glutamate--ammonia ligase [Roseobacter denitrificans]|uniref:Glutamine synthetase III n=1 Tax=Roseobacter denitrificans (strain ATCC 33942 / OCh 114) TaxID=375451 RepID=Q160A8_ROSDO|nr:type III glutamate--ammonia ligase [Roseobacter denitrificans]ABG33685.1 glutamine synthetase III [Roseobacter denitrificans OCh 114]AVL52973.1 type III glutamate--ammonia ligase [Roseobacter denitrificans]SFG28014.1 glutamine synthetase [Roseobacter denitrificans OCh 114]